MKQTFLLMALCGTAAAALAQENETSQRAWFTEIESYATSVNNDGQAIIFKQQRKPYEIWTPRTGERKIIGGESAGSGVGGLGSFSDDGSRVSAVKYSDAIIVNSKWEKTVHEDAAINFKAFNSVGFYIYAIGSSDDGQAGLMMRSSNGGKTWRKMNVNVDNIQQGWLGGIECMGWVSPIQSYVGCHNGAFYYGATGGTSYVLADPHPAGNTDEVKTYWAIDFMDEEDANLVKTYGTFGIELADGTGAVWYSTDGMESTKAASGVTGVPAHITHVGEIYFMVTRNGHIQKSEDRGATWKDVFLLNAEPAPFDADGTPMFSRIKFADPQNGMALATGAVYVTVDGGETWTKNTVADNLNDIIWRDIAFDENGTATIAGNGGNVYETADMGGTWTKIELEADCTTDMMGIMVTSESTNVCGAQGTFFYRSLAEKVKGYTAAIYDIEKGEWSDLPCTGFLSDEAISSAENISGDGSTVVGGVYNYDKEKGYVDVCYDAAAWMDGKLIVLGTKFPETNSSAKACKASYDGSVIVGWQDHMMPRYASVWRKNSSGGYDQSLMLKDPSLTEADVNMDFTDDGRIDITSKVLGQCNAVSSDGKWIGGRGVKTWYAVDGAWLWSEETGLKLLDPTPGADDMVYDMTNDASFVVGQVGPGASAWVWTEETGKKEMNRYLTENLGIDLGEYHICGVMDLSPNGRYITGWCMKGMGKYAYVVDLKGGTTSIEKPAEQVKAAVYPNPVATDLHIDLPFSDLNTRISLYSLQGCLIRTMTTANVNNVMNVSDIAPGLYVLNVNAKGVNKSFKVEIKH